MDGAIIAVVSTFATAASTHLTFAQKTSLKPGGPAGTHKLELRWADGTITDINDRFHVTVLELPF